MNRFVSYNLLATYISLLQTVLPNSKEIKDYEMKLAIVAQGESIKKADFAKVEAWFDAFECSKQRPGADIFDRVSMIKDMIFEVNKESGKVT